jgi:hypothetical protein
MDIRALYCECQATTVNPCSFCSWSLLMHPWFLGFSWLQSHNPLMDWVTGSIMGWSPFCHVNCWKSAQPAPRDIFLLAWEKTWISPPFLRINRIYGRLSTLPKPNLFRRIDPTTMLSTLSQALLFTRFHFTICYCPGSNNVAACTVCAQNKTLR